MMLVSASFTAAFGKEKHPGIEGEFKKMLGDHGIKVPEGDKTLLHMNDLDTPEKMIAEADRIFQGVDSAALLTALMAFNAKYGKKNDLEAAFKAISDVKGEGDTATGQVEVGSAKKPMNFQKIDGRWYLDVQSFFNNITIGFSEYLPSRIISKIMSIRLRKRALDKCPGCGGPFKGQNLDCPVCGGMETITPETGPATIPEKGSEDLVRIAGPGSGERYVDHGEIARGGMGAIRDLEDRDLNRRVARKILLDSKDPGMVARFVEEAQITGQLQHPNIVPVHEIGHDPGGAWYFTMKKVEGRSLADLVLQKLAPGETPSARLSRLLEVFLKVCDAVGYAHSKNVIHRDLKPDNVMAGSFGEVLVMDFGLAKVKGKREKTGSGIGRVPADRPKGQVQTVRSMTGAGKTIAGNVIGTPTYMAPEQAMGQLDIVDEKSDIWALGAILYFILCGKDPYSGSNEMDVIYQAGLCLVIPPRKRSPAAFVPAELESICLKAMSEDRKRRYRSVEDLAGDVRAYIERRAVSAHRYGPLQLLSLWVQRHPTSSVAAGLSAFLLLVGAGLASFLIQQARISKILAEQMRVLAERQTRRADEAETGRETAEEMLEKGRKVSKTLREADAELGGLVLALKKAVSSNSASNAKIAGDRARAAMDDFCAARRADKTALSAALAARGWLIRLSGDAEAALKAFDESRETDPDVAFGWVFEALHWIDSYLSRRDLPLTRISRGGIAFDPMPPDTSEMALFRKNLAAAIEGMRSARVWGESAHDDFLSVLAGFSALNEGDYETAVKGLTKALAQPETAWMREELLLARAKARYLAKDMEGALSDAKLALERLPEMTGALYLAGSAYGALADLAAERGEDPSEALSMALKSMQEYVSRKRTQVSMSSLGLARMNAGKKTSNPREAIRLLEEACRDFSDSLKADPSYTTASNNRGTCFMSLADMRDLIGQDPLHDLLNAEKDFCKALETDPSFLPALLNRGSVRVRIAPRDSGVSRDPAKILDEAREDLEKVLEARPGDADAMDVLGAVFLERAEMADRSGRDPRADFEAAAAWYSRAAAARPGYAGHMNNRGNVNFVRARSERAKGADPSAALEEAMKDFTRALEINPSFLIALKNRGLILRDQAKSAASGQAFEAFCARALNDFDQALSLSPGYVDGLCDRAETYLLLAERRFSAGGNPEEALSKAIADSDAALDPGRTVRAVKIAAKIRFFAGQIDSRRGRDPAENFGKAVERFSEALLANPNSAASYNNRGTALLEWALAEQRAGSASTGLIERALADFDSALRVNPRQYEAYMNRGTCRLKLGGLHAAADKAKSVAFLEAALPDFETAAPRLPGMWYAWLYRAEALENLGRFEESLDDLARATASGGADAPALRSARARVDSAAEKSGHEWMTPIRRALQLAADENFEAAAAGLEKSLAQAPKPEGARAAYLVAKGRFELARSLAALSAGIGLSEVPADSASIREKSVAALRLAMEAGWRDFSLTARDNVFMPLRGLDSFKSLAAEWAGKPGAR